MTKKIGVLALSVFLILWGLVQLLPDLSSRTMLIILGIIAIAAGALLLLDR
jgi:hypothetical protein